MQLFKKLFTIVVMFRGKANTVIGLTVCHGEYLGVSVPAVAKLSGDYLLVVNNTNPDQIITTRAIRKIGYRGRLHIINSTACSGVLSARMAIMDAARNIMPNAEWIVFINDCDILVDCRAPHVLENNFAIIQNAVSTRGQLLNVLRLMGTGDWRTLPDGDVQLLRPHVGMSGTLVRFDAACQMCSVLRRIYDIISASCDCVGDIPAFARIAPHNTATIHNRYDTSVVMSPAQTIEDMKFIIAFSNRMAQAKYCPVARTMPDNMKEKLDEYLARKRPKNA